MKFLFLAFFFFIGVQALTEQQKNIVKEHYRVCREETGVDNELVQRARNGDFDFDDAKVKSCIACMFRRIQLIDEEGNFKKDFALTKIAEEDKEAVSRAIDACDDKKGDNIDEISWNYAKCYIKERPNAFIF